MLIYRYINDSFLIDSFLIDSFLVDSFEIQGNLKIHQVTPHWLYNLIRFYHASPQPVQY